MRHMAEATINFNHLWGHLENEVRGWIKQRSPGEFAGCKWHKQDNMTPVTMITAVHSDSLYRNYNTEKIMV